ncbi:MAG TPA: hypothetical protein VM939_09740 [Gemmatimonadaceae bacterium]|nr:hypothetical protein [Gemmatimonadaceae bacterium]
MTEDERIDEMIRNAAQDYNRAPAVPRDEMWTAIQAARTGATPKLHVIAGNAAAPRTADRGRSFFAPRYVWLGAAAAVLLVATGIGIGRLTMPVQQAAINTGNNLQASDSNSSVTPQRVADDNPGPGTYDPPPPSVAQTPAGEIDVEPETSRGGIGRVLRGAAPSGASRVASSRLPSRRNAAGIRGSVDEAPGNDTYQVATIRHLADAEALLTSFSLEKRDQKMDAQLAGWAKGLLSNTRLLLDSPAGEDARRARLLEDLELVLAQIVQLSPAAAASERELIQGSIQNGQVMTRLRTAIPAGPTRGL